MSLSFLLTGCIQSETDLNKNDTDDENAEEITASNQNKTGTEKTTKNINQNIENTNDDGTKKPISVTTTSYGADNPISVNQLLENPGVYENAKEITVIGHTSQVDDENGEPVL